MSSESESFSNRAIPLVRPDFRRAQETKHPISGLSLSSSKIFNPDCAADLSPRQKLFQTAKNALLSGPSPRRSKSTSPSLPRSSSLLKFKSERKTDIGRKARTVRVKRSNSLHQNKYFPKYFDDMSPALPGFSFLDRLGSFWSNEASIPTQHPRQGSQYEDDSHDDFPQDDKIQCPLPEVHQPKKIVSFGKFFQFATKKDRILILIALFSAFIAGFTTPAFAFIYARVLSNFSTPIKFFDQVQSLSWGFLLLGAYSFFFIFLEESLISSAAVNQLVKIRRAFVASTLRQDLTYFDKTKPGTLVARLICESTYINDAMGLKLGQFVREFSSTISGILIGVLMGWHLGLSILISLPILFGLVLLFTGIVSKSSSDEQEGYSIAGRVAVECLGSIKTVQCFNAEEQEALRYDKALLKAEKAGVKAQVISGFTAAMTLFVAYLSFAFTVWFGSVLISEDVYNFFTDKVYASGDILGVLLCLLQSFFSLAQLVPLWSIITRGRVAATQIYATIDRHSQLDPLSVEGVLPDHELSGTIEFKNVHFQYPTRPYVEVFNDFNLTIKAGERIAIVGGSGSGKTTILSLIERLYDLQGGTITIDGYDIKELNTRWLRQQIGFVQQEPLLFQGTIAENIRAGFPELGISVREAAEIANADLFINRLPEGYNTQVGELGVQLSGGEKQRISIASAIHRNPSILILDEATSALDAENERQIQKAIDRLMRGKHARTRTAFIGGALPVASSPLIKRDRTTIIVAHRLTTVKKADRILVLHKGKLVEEGKYQDLIDKNGYFAKMLSSQLSADGEMEQQRATSEAPKRKGHYRNKTRGSFSQTSPNLQMDKRRLSQSSHKGSETESSRIIPQLNSNVKSASISSLSIPVESSPRRRRTSKDQTNRHHTSFDRRRDSKHKGSEDSMNGSREFSLDSLNINELLSNEGVFDEESAPEQESHTKKLSRRKHMRSHTSFDGSGSWSQPTDFRETRKIAEETQIEIQKKREADLLEAKKKAQEEERASRFTMKSFIRLIILIKNNWIWMVLGGVLTCVAACTQPLFVIFISDMINIYQSPDRASLPSKALPITYKFIGLAFLFLFGTIVSRYALGKVGERLTFQLRSLCYRSILRQSSEFFDKEENSVGNLNSRLQMDATKVHTVTTDRISNYLSVLVILIAGIAIAFVSGPKLSAVMAVCLPFCLVGSLISGSVTDELLVQKKADGKDEKKVTGSVSQAFGLAREAFLNLIALKIQTAERRIIKLFNEMVDIICFVECRIWTFILGLILGVGSS